MVTKQSPGARTIFGFLYVHNTIIKKSLNKENKIQKNSIQLYASFQQSKFMSHFFMKQVHFEYLTAIKILFFHPCIGKHILFYFKYSVFCTYKKRQNVEYKMGKSVFILFKYF